VLYMPGPGTYTGEDTVEVSCHGNPVITETVVERCVQLGAQLAGPGSFTRRALMHGRLDVVAAEGVGALIEARTARGVAVARDALDGRVSTEVAALSEILLDAAAEMEARIDHPEEELGTFSDQEVAERLMQVSDRAVAAAASWRSGRVAVRGARVALVGPTNAGKSSLFNRLVGLERALVSDLPGTTRDVVEQTVVHHGLEITFLDTAGLRANAEGLERAGQQLGARLTEDVDLRLAVYALPEAPPETCEPNTLAVGTHRDLLATPVPEGAQVVSNVTGQGVDDLIALLVQNLQGGAVAGQRLSLSSQRQHDLFVQVARHCRASRQALLEVGGPVVAAEELTSALEKLGTVVGTNVREAVLDRLFSRFCIGK